MNNKTSHQLARELLAGPDLIIWHFDPSRAGLAYEIDTSLSVPEIQKNDSREGLTDEEVEDYKEEGAFMGEFLTICGEEGPDGEAMSQSEADRLHALKELSKRVHSGYDFNADPDGITLLVGKAIAGEPSQ